MVRVLRSDEMTIRSPERKSSAWKRDALSNGGGWKTEGLAPCFQRWTRLTLAVVFSRFDPHVFARTSQTLGRLLFHRTAVILQNALCHAGGWNSATARCVPHQIFRNATRERAEILSTPCDADPKRRRRRRRVTTPSNHRGRVVINIRKWHGRNKTLRSSLSRDFADDCVKRPRLRNFDSAYALCSALRSIYPAMTNDEEPVSVLTNVSTSFFRGGLTFPRVVISTLSTCRFYVQYSFVRVIDFFNLSVVVVVMENGTYTFFVKIISFLEWLV